MYELNNREKKTNTDARQKCSMMTKKGFPDTQGPPEVSESCTDGRTKHMNSHRRKHSQQCTCSQHSPPAFCPCHSVTDFTTNRTNSVTSVTLNNHLWD